jgi:deoxyribodipyrimidine photo-lyase
VIVVWFRRDLRLGDHPALAEAAARGPVVPAFVLDPALLGRAPRRDGWIAATLAALDADLRARGARLVVRRGEPAAELVRLAGQAGATAIWWNRDTTPYARARDTAVAAAARGVGLESREFEDAALTRPDDVVPARGGFYTVFTPYHRAWLAQAGGRLLLAPARLTTAAALETLPIPATGAAGLPPAGEQAAGAALQTFVRSGLAGYAAARDRLDLDATSRLSPYLRVGALSPRQVHAAIASAAARAPALATPAAGFIRQLAWREFFTQILWHAPVTRRAPLRPPRTPVRWRRAPAALQAWQEGRTGYPVVDAGMRQLAATGWLPNRARMIVASFLVKHLLLDWREGDRWFMRQLLDGDPALNGGNWQWVASVGADALPAFRIFNPVTQGRRFDPDGDYVRRWVPELAAIAAAHVHAPWEVGGAPGYPPPIVEHVEARRRALAAFGAGPRARS